MTTSIFILIVSPESPTKGYNNNRRPQSNHSAQGKAKAPYNHNPQEEVNEKFNKYDYVQTQANSPIKNVAHFEPEGDFSQPVPQQDFRNSYYNSGSKPTPVQHQSTFYGRKL